MLLGKLKTRHWRQKQSLQSKQDLMSRPIDDTKTSSIILTWIFKIFVLAFFGFIIAFPFYFMISQSLTDKQWSMVNSSSILWYPKKFGVTYSKFEAHWENFKFAFQEGYGKALLMTFIVTSFSVVARVFFSMSFGYAFSLRKWRFKSFSWAFFLSLLVLPEVALLSGQYFVAVKLGWHIGTWRFVSLMMPFVASVFSGFMYRNAFEDIPDSVKESALIDGTSGFKFFIKIAMPMVKTTTWTVCILTALATWNSYTWPLLILGKQAPGSWTVMNIWLTDTGQVKNDPDGNRVYMSIRMAATILAILPMLIVYFSLRKRIMNAISRQGRASKG